MEAPAVFRDPVAGAQTSFRAVMAAMAEPGRITAAGAGLTPPAPLSPAAAAVLLTLADPETPVWFERAAPGAADWLRFHTGAPPAADPPAASFGVLERGGSADGWAAHGAGTAADPHLSATLLLPVAALEGGAPLRLTGPGIDGARDIAPAGLPAGFVAAMATNGARYPMGFDVILTSGERLLALPRSTRLAEG